MKKALFTVLLISIFFSFGIAKKRINGDLGKVSMEELTDPQSPSYTPYPYPQTRHEIIEDLKYAISYLKGPRTRSYGQEKTAAMKSLPKLLKNDPDVKIGQVIKLKNRIKEYHDDYSFIIIITDKEKKPLARVALCANGLFLGAAYSSERYALKPLKKEKEVLEILTQKLRIEERKLKIKKAERIFIQSSLYMLYPFSPPLWEIELSDGSGYFLRQEVGIDPTVRIYKKIREKEWLDTKEAQKENRRLSRVEGQEVVYDKEKGKVLILREVTAIEDKEIKRTNSGT